jgi:hypothetical protein
MGAAVVQPHRALVELAPPVDERVARIALTAIAAGGVGACRVVPTPDARTLVDVGADAVYVREAGLALNLTSEASPIFDPGPAGQPCRAGNSRAVFTVRRSRTADTIETEAARCAALIEAEHLAIRDASRAGLGKRGANTVDVARHLPAIQPRAAVGAEAPVPATALPE